jgi:amino acid transporter
MTLVNLRGVRESGRIFAVPTYFFLFTMLFMLVVGLIKYVLGDLGTVKHVDELVRHDVQSLTLFLVLRAFSSGCTALTGVEAISNGITAFKEPKSKNAATTLTYMSGIMVVLMIGLTLLSHQVSALPSESETVFSQVGRTVFGGGSIFYVAVLSATALILGWRPCTLVMVSCRASLPIAAAVWFSPGASWAWLPAPRCWSSFLRRALRL